MQETIHLTDILHTAPKKHIATLLILSLFMMITSVSITGLPLLFLDPLVLRDGKQITLEDACENGNYIIDTVNGVNSLTAEF